MNPLAVELNKAIEKAEPCVHGMLSSLGKRLFFPRGILTQTAEAKEKADRHNATIGIARENGQAMNLDVLMDNIPGVVPDDALDYAPATGVPALRRIWRSEIYRKNPSLKNKSISLPVVTSGITHGLTLAGQLFLDPGDIVIVPDKFWGNYRLSYETIIGAEIRTFPLFDNNGGFNVEGLSARLNESLDARGKVLLVLNFPNNPTGYSLLKSEVEPVVESIRSASGPGRDIVVISDDAYFGLLYSEDAYEESIFARLASLDEHIIPVKLDGATKEHFAWGLRVGFITFSASGGVPDGEFYQALEKKTGGAIRGGISNCSRLSQTVILKALENESFADQRDEKFRVLERRALKVKEALANPAYDEVWEPYPFNAGYFMCLKLKNINAEELRCSMLDRFGVGVIASGNNDLRIAFSCLDVDDIPDLFDIMFTCALEMKHRG
ncbi:MAG: aminotransferase class I/II-fold pyridoxal phosphate-dependent enzyme [Actinobacteria bacterium]|nr:aminotransferase class I/II-fold pyridoxal phosphate-dependent enzyme [Actinomycetota bacterium]